MDKKPKKLQKIFETFITCSKQHVLLVIILGAYIVFEVMFVIPLPVVGIHAWNESIYLSFVNYMRETGNPFVFRAAYDPVRPDYNVGYLFFWASYIFQSIAQRLSSTLESFLWFSRIFSLISTILSSLVIYVISVKLVKKKFCAYFNVVSFLFSPLILYFGTKFQLEPFTFLIFLLSWLFIIKYTETTKIRYIIASFVALGALILTRQIYAIYVPALLTYLLAKDRANQKKNSKISIGLAILSILLGFVIPLALTQTIVPQYSPIKFQFFRLIKSPTMAFSGPWQSENLILLYVEKSLLPSLGLSFIFVITSIILLLFLRSNLFNVNRKITIVFILGGAVYFAFAFLHNIVHMYHSYYFLPPVILTSSIVTASILKMNCKSFVAYLIFFLIVSLIFSVWETINFYGICSDRIYRDIDAYGNLDSVFAGYLVNRIYHISKNNSLLDRNVTYYSLVQSPAVYFYAEMPCISYYDFYEWNLTSQEYQKFNFFVDQESFLKALQKRNLLILTITPDVYNVQTESFKQFIQEKFVFLASVGVYTFYLNRTIFNRAPSLYKNQALAVLSELKESSLAPSWLSYSILNTSYWYRISERSQPFNKVVLNQKLLNFSIDSNELNNKAFSIEISLTPKFLPKKQLIISLDNIVNIRYGTSDDIYLQLISTDDGYRWFDGAYIAPFLWQTLNVTFVYDSEANRAEIYFNGFLVSDTLRGVNDNSFSPLRPPQKHFITIMCPTNVTELYSIRLWNRSLSIDELRSGKISNDGLVFSLP